MLRRRTKTKLGQIKSCVKMSQLLILQNIRDGINKRISKKRNLTSLLVEVKFEIKYIKQNTKSTSKCHL